MSSRAGFLHLAAILAVAQSSFAQTVPSATPSGASLPVQTRSAPAPVATFKAAAQLVVVDVVVTGNGLLPIHGLKASAFKLTENGVPQVIKNFEEHTALTMADATKFTQMPTLPPGVFTNYTPTPANGAVNLILLDSVNTPMLDQSYVREQFLAYLKATPPGTRIAIFGLTTTHLILLQGFTADVEVLKAAIARERPKGSALLADPVGGRGVHESLADDMESWGAGAATVANMRDSDAREQSLLLKSRARCTLDAMKVLARYLSGIPGRKNLIWFSGSFPLSLSPDTASAQADPFAGMSEEDEFRTAVSMLARSQVAVYPIDARGLMTSAVFNGTMSRYSSPQGGRLMQQDDSQFWTTTWQEHETMRVMADATGGRAFVNTNGLTDAVQKAVVDGANFYTLTYTPMKTERDGKLRKIRVEVARPGVQLAYRKGYYADDPEKVPKADAATTAAADPSTGQALLQAMSRGAPTPTEIMMKVGVVSMTPAGQAEDEVAAGNVPSANTQGPYRRYSVNYAIEPRDITFQKLTDGKVHGDFDLIIFVFDPNGVLVNGLQAPIHLAGSLEQIQQAASHGLVFHEEVSAPAKGQYFLRIAVHDRHRDHYGAVEVATADVKNGKAVK